MKLVSWNVNGIRAFLRKGGLAHLTALDADIFCLQEVRALPEQFELPLEGYQAHYYPAEKKGYAGTAVLSRVPLLDVSFGLGLAEHDKEGRVITAALDDFFLVTVYTPNSGRGLVRHPYRTKTWDGLFLNHLKELEKTKPVVFCGDLNVAHKEIDLANPASNGKNAGFTPEERANFDQLVAAGFVDTFREFCKDGGRYSWWSNFAKSRERNIGWRIDYFGASEALRPQLLGADIHESFMGSDHCPISLEIGLPCL